MIRTTSHAFGIGLIAVYAVTTVICANGLNLIDKCLSIASDPERADGKYLQVHITHFTHPSGARVVLIPTVHLAEQQFYDEINKKLQHADAAIYEGIERRLTKNLIQEKIPESLALVKQTDAVVCEGEKFVRGDLDEETFERLRDKTIPIAKTPDTRQKFAAAILSAQDDPRIREATDSALAIKPRNHQAIKKLQHLLNKGDTQIVMLYGAAHIPDIHKRLLDDLGFNAQRTEIVRVFSFKNE